MPSKLLNKILAKGGIEGYPYIINKNEYEKRCKDYKNLYENIPDDIPVKMYFDADHFFFNNFENYNLDVAASLLELHKKYISLYFRNMCNIEPTFSVATSHTTLKIKDGKECWGYSFHIVIQNIKAYKNIQLDIVNKINEGIIELECDDNDSKHRQLIGENKYEDYMNVDSIFDNSVYSNNQFMRSVHSSKDNERRPLILCENSTFEEMVISDFITDDCFLYDYDLGKKTETLKIAIPTMIDNNNRDILLFKALCESGCMKKYAESYSTHQQYLF